MAIVLFMYTLRMRTGIVHSVPVLYLLHCPVYPGDVDDDSYPGEYESDQHGTGHDFTTQQADYQGDTGRAVHEDARNRNGHTLDTGRKKHHRNGRHDTCSRQQEPLQTVKCPDCAGTVKFTEPNK